MRNTRYLEWHIVLALLLRAENVITIVG